jgi:AcrR family transcriptional regulator
MMDSASATENSSRRASALETRRRLLVAGRRAFAAKGLAGTNLKSHILVPAGVSVGSFYHQFRDKTELLLAIMDEYDRDFRARLKEIRRPRPGRNTLGMARELYSMILDNVDENPDLVAIQLRERGSDDERVSRSLRSARERWIASVAEDYQKISQASSIEVEAHLLASLTVALALGAMAQYLEAPRSERPEFRERLLEGLVRFTLGGIPAMLKPAEAVLPFEEFEPRNLDS